MTAEPRGPRRLLLVLTVLTATRSTLACASDSRENVVDDPYLAQQAWVGLGYRLAIAAVWVIGVQLYNYACLWLNKIA
jgi:hypothetical protein